MEVYLLVSIDISIVMPCLNEEETVGVCVEKAQQWLTAKRLSGEIIVVDNGSTDRSPAVAEAAGATVVHEQKRGYGNAYLRGLSETQGRYIVMGDSDDTYDFCDLDDLVAPLESGYDMVIGNRLKGPMDRGAMPWLHRHVGTPAINFILRMFTGAPVGDSQSGLRAFTRDAYLEMGLRSQGMELASEMILNASRRGLQITEVPIPYLVRRGESKLNTFRDGWRHLRFLLTSTPNALFLMPGLTMLMLGLVTLVLAFTFPEGLDVGSLTWQPIFASGIFLVVGTNAIIFGALTRLLSGPHRTSYVSANGARGNGRHTSRADRPTRWVEFYRTRLRLEGLLLIAAGIVLAGIALDLILFSVWLTDSNFPRTLQFAGLAQSLIIIGVNLAMASFLAVVLEQEPAP